MIVARDEIINHITGFSKAVGINVKVHEGSPRTDGDQIWMDCRPCNTRREFQGRCGIVSHEAAHVLFDTPKQCRDWAKRIIRDTGADEWLKFAAHECCNVIVDIADETRMEKFMPPCMDDMQIGNELAATSIAEFYRSYMGPCTRGKHIKTRSIREACQPPWRWAMLLAIIYHRLIGKKGLWAHSEHGIWLACLRNWKRGIPTFQKGTTPMASPTAGDLTQVHIICGKAKTRVKTLAACGARKPREWTKLYGLSRDLFEIIKDHIQPSDKPPDEGKPGQEGSEGKGGAGGSDVGKRAREQGQENQVKKGEGKGPGKPGPQVGGQYGGQASNQNTSVWVDPRIFDQAAYSSAKTAMRKRAETLMETETQQVCRQADEGEELNSDWTQLWGEGQVFNRMDLKEDSKLSLAMLLDISGSMSKVIGKTQAVCKAFAEALAESGADVRCWTFGHHTKEVDYRRLHEKIILEGDTRGALAVSHASKWLEGVPSGRKIVMILTDGTWFDSSVTHGTMLRGGSHGIEYVLIGMKGYDRESLKYGFIGGIRAVTTESPAALVEHLIRDMGRVKV